MIKILAVIILCILLSSCKLITLMGGAGTGKVASGSGSIDCQSGDDQDSFECSEYYESALEDCPGYDANDTAKDEAHELNCTVVGSAGITEAYYALPDENNTASGWMDICAIHGADACTVTLSQDDTTYSDKTIELNFEPDPSPQDATYVYNYLGQRAKKTVNGESTLFIYDEQGHILSEIDLTPTSPTYGKPLVEYIYALNMLITVITTQYDGNGDATGETIYNAFIDHLGQPVALFDKAGNQVWERLGHAFGKDYATLSAGFDLLMRFPGQYYDLETGYYQNNHREYDAGTGRYIQPDPLGLFDGNPYVYAHNSPINLIDFWGLAVQICNTFTPFPHTFLRTDNYSAGYGMTTLNPFNSPGAIVPQDSDSGVCGDPVPSHNCTQEEIEVCVDRVISVQGPTGTTYSIQGYNCGNWVYEVITDCWTELKCL